MTRLPDMRRAIPDDLSDSDLYHHELALERGDWPEPSTVPFPLPDETLSQELPLEPAPFEADVDQPTGWDDVEPF